MLESIEVFSRYIIWTIFVVMHISVVGLVMLGGFWWWFCLFLHPLVQIQWMYCRYHCVATLIERCIHPQGKSLFGRIRWWSIILLWTDWVVVLIYNFLKNF